jgi:RuvB-like protein 1 (pontin 52)
LTTKIKINVVKSTEREERIAVHSHLRGLGLTTHGAAEINESGFIGQDKAREAAGIVVQLVEQKIWAGKAVLFVGPPGTGKTAIALAISQELGTGVPFCPMVGSEVYSSEVKPTEILTENFRRAIGLRLKEKADVIQGVLKKITVNESANQSGGYGKSIKLVSIVIQATKGTRTFTLPPDLYEEMQKQKIRVGDVIYVEVDSGRIVREGRYNELQDEGNLEIDKYLPMPKGDPRQTRYVTKIVCLHDLDVANANPKGDGNDVAGFIARITRSKKTEITDKLRTEVNKTVTKFIDSGIAELVPGVLFIDEVHTLDMDCFAFLNKALESPLAPVVVFATNRTRAKITGTNIESPFGMTRDLLDRLVIINTSHYSKPEMKAIVQKRATVEKIQLNNEALDLLTQIGVQFSLRYALQLLAPAQILAEVNDRDNNVEKADIEKCFQLFIDPSRSKAFADECQQAFLNS